MEQTANAEAAPAGRAPRHGRVASRVAGGALVMLGAVLAAFGAVAAGFVPQFGLPWEIELSLMLSGIVTGWVGVLVWRGSRPLTLVALTVLGGLFVLQFTQFVALADPEDELLYRLILTGVLVALLGLAAVRTRR